MPVVARCQPPRLTPPSILGPGPKSQHFLLDRHYVQVANACPVELVIHSGNGNAGVTGQHMLLAKHLFHIHANLGIARCPWREREGGPRTVLRSPLPLQQATFFFPPSEVTAKSKCRRLCQIFQVVASAAAAVCIPSAATLGIVEKGERGGRLRPRLPRRRRWPKAE